MTTQHRHPSQCSFPDIQDASARGSHRLGGRATARGREPLARTVGISGNRAEGRRGGGAEIARVQPIGSRRSGALLRINSDALLADETRVCSPAVLANIPPSYFFGEAHLNPHPLSVPAAFALA